MHRKREYTRAGGQAGGERVRGCVIFILFFALETAQAWGFLNSDICFLRLFDFLDLFLHLFFFIEFIYASLSLCVVKMLRESETRARAAAGTTEPREHVISPITDHRPVAATFCISYR